MRKPKTRKPAGQGGSRKQSKSFGWLEGFESYTGSSDSASPLSTAREEIEINGLRYGTIIQRSQCEFDAYGPDDLLIESCLNREDAYWAIAEVNILDADFALRCASSPSPSTH